MNRLQLGDEILQMLYWMRGEKIADRVAVEQIDRFLRAGTSAIEEALERLVRGGLVIRDGGLHSLSETGVREGGRRFTEEFSAVLGKEDHLTCSDPGCDCHSTGWDGVCHSSGAGNVR